MVLVLVRALELERGLLSCSRVPRARVPWARVPRVRVAVPAAVSPRSVYTPTGCTRSLQRQLLHACAWIVAARCHLASPANAGGAIFARRCDALTRCRRTVGSCLSGNRPDSGGDPHVVKSTQSRVSMSRILMRVQVSRGASPRPTAARSLPYRRRRSGCRPCGSARTRRVDRARAPS